VYPLSHILFHVLRRFHSHRAKEEVKRIQSVPLVIGQFNEMIDAHYGIVGSTGENAARK
jgi:ATP-dependent 26S proteasome regulatory subunit